MLDGSKLNLGLKAAQCHIKQRASPGCDVRSLHIGWNVSNAIAYTEEDGEEAIQSCVICYVAVCLPSPSHNMLDQERQIWGFDFLYSTCTLCLYLHVLWSRTMGKMVSLTAWMKNLWFLPHLFYAWFPFIELIIEFVQSSCSRQSFASVLPIGRILGIRSLLVTFSFFTLLLFGEVGLN